jgi:hypothetical protein
MGWLDNSTNNIILDAVLTDFGRRQLATAVDGSSTFKIYKFALGDDEVNYSIIKKYGRTVGREKIEKNTPIFEAFTNQNLSQKYKLFSCPVPILYVPKLELASNATTISLTNSSINNAQLSTSTEVVVYQKPRGNESIPVELFDSTFEIRYPNLFLAISQGNIIGSQVSNINQENSVSSVKFPSSPAVQNTQRKLTFNVQVKYLSNAIFNVYGNNATPKVINTSITVVGINTGISLTIPVSISQ